MNLEQIRLRIDKIDDEILFSTPSNIGDPIPGGIFFMAHSIMPPTLSPSFFACKIFSIITSFLSQLITGNRSLDKFIKSSSERFPSNFLSNTLKIE